MNTYNTHTHRFCAHTHTHTCTHTYNIIHTYTHTHTHNIVHTPDSLGSSRLAPSHSPSHSVHKMVAFHRASWTVWRQDSIDHTFCRNKMPHPGKCQLPRGPCTRPNRRGWRGWVWSWGCGYCSPCCLGQNHRSSLESPMIILTHTHTL